MLNHFLTSMPFAEMEDNPPETLDPMTVDPAPYGDVSLQRQWIWCYAHLVQLAMKWGFSDIRNGHVSRLISDMKDIVKHLRKHDAGRLLTKTLKKHLEIRWDSMVIMIETFLCEENSARLNQIASEWKLTGKTIDRGMKLSTLLEPLNRKILSQVCTLLNVIQQERLDLSSEQYPTLGMVPLSRHFLIQEMNKIFLSPEYTTEVHDLARCISQRIQEKVKITEVHAAALILNPACPVKLAKQRLPGSLFDKGLKLIEDLMAKVIRTGSHEEPDQPVVDAETNNAEGFLSKYGDGMNLASQERSEMSRYMERGLVAIPNHEIGKWWKMNKPVFPDLFKVAVLFQAPATSVKAERTFSEAGHRLGKDKLRLYPEKLENIVMITSDGKYQDRNMLT